MPHKYIATRKTTIELENKSPRVKEVTVRGQFEDERPVCAEGRILIAVIFDENKREDFIGDDFFVIVAEAESFVKSLN